MRPLDGWVTPDMPICRPSLTVPKADPRKIVVIFNPPTGTMFIIGSFADGIGRSGELIRWVLGEKSRVGQRLRSWPERSSGRSRGRGIASDIEYLAPMFREAGFLVRPTRAFSE